MFLLLIGKEEIIMKSNTIFQSINKGHNNSLDSLQDDNVVKLNNHSYYQHDNSKNLNNFFPCSKMD